MGKLRMYREKARNLMDRALAFDVTNKRNMSAIMNSCIWHDSDLPHSSFILKFWVKQLCYRI
jgi:hypothetical protein